MMKTRSIDRTGARVAAVVGVCLCVALPASAQERARSEHLPLELLESGGAALGNVIEIVESTDGHLWLATWDGLLRFDGDRFENFSDGDGGVVPGNPTALVELRLDEIWVGGTPRNAAPAGGAWVGPE